MSTDSLNISLTDPAKSFVEAEVAAGECGTASEYVASVLLAERRRKAMAVVAQLISDGMNSGPSIEATDEFWDEIRRETESPHS
jgi:antitoxin ParD1/3/4